MEIRFRVEAWEETAHIPVEELVSRLTSHFRSALIDRKKGDAYVQAGLDRLMEEGAPDVILDSHKSYFGNVAFVSVSESRWGGATATSYLHQMWPPLGDTVFFEVMGTDEPKTDMIARELETALGMVRCSAAGSRLIHH